MANEAKSSAIITLIDNVTDVAKRITGQFGTLSSSYGKLITALGIGAGVTYLTRLVQQSLEAADSLGDLAASVGVNVTTLSKYKLAADASGTTVEGLAQGLKKLSVNMFDASNGTGEAQDAFRALGIDVRDANGQLRSADEVLLQVADTFAKTENGTAKTALAVRLFGKAGAELIPFLNNGRAGLQDFADTAEALGLVLDEKTVAAADRTNDALGILGQVSSGFGNRLLREVLPTLEGLAKMFLDGAKSGSSFAQIMTTLVGGALKTVATIGITVFETLRGVGGVIAAVVAAAVQAVQGNFSGAFSILKDGLADTGNIAASAKDKITALWSDSLPKLSNAEIAAAKALELRNTAQQKATKATEDARAKLLAEVAAIELNHSATGKLTDAQKLMLKIGEALRDGKVKLTEAEKREVFARLAAVDATVALRKAMDDAEKADAKGIETAQKGLAQLREQIDRQREHNATIGLSGTALAALEQRRLLDAAATAEQTAQTLVLAGESETLIRLYREQASALRTLAGEKAAGIVAEAHAAAAKQAEDEWRKTSDSISGSLTDALLRGFESGKGILQNLRDTAVNLFKSLVLRPIIQPIAGAAAGGLLSLLGLAPSVANAATGAGGLNLLSSAGLLGGAFGALGTFGGSALASIGNVINGGLFTGSAANLANLFSSGGSIAGALGTVAPYVAALGALASLFGNKSKPARQNFSFLDQFGAAAGNPFPTPKLDSSSAFDDVLRPLIASIAQTAAALGGAAGDLRFGLFTSASPDNKGAQVVAQVSRGAEFLFRADTQGSNESVQSRIEAALPQILLAGLQGADLPQVFADFFRRIDLTSATQAQIDAAIQTAGAAKTMADAVRGLGGVFAQVGGLSVDARTNILGLVGGLDAFVAKTQGFVTEFFSAQEQGAIAAASVARTLQAAGVDIAGLDTRSEFRALVDSLNLQTDSGQQQLAALLNVAQSFAGLTETLQSQGLTLEELAAQAPIDNLAQITAIGQQTQQRQLESIDSRLQSVEGALQSVASAVGASMSAIVGAVNGIAARPIELTVTAPEVNGGFSAVGGGA